MPSSDRLTRVRLGPIPDPHAVEAMLDRVKRDGYPAAFVVGRGPERAPAC
jgi:cell division septation protein DedD